jgi:ribosomal protein S18 acetylase RimI-like enzyme
LIRGQGMVQPSDIKSTSIQIRLAVPDDAPAIASVLFESFIEYQSQYTEAGFAATAIGNDEIQHRMKEGPIWVAVEQDVIVGAVSAVIVAERLYIRGMAILPMARGQGIGQSLLTRIETFASEQHIQHLFLSTTPFLNRAIRLYERCGFRRRKEGPSDLFGTPLFTMEKILESSDS